MKSWQRPGTKTISAAVSRHRSMIRGSPATAEEAHKATTPRKRALLMECSLA